jgi:hypothetical protein
MASDKLKLNIIDIPGVSIRRTNEAVEFCFLKPLNYDEWHGIENVIIQMQKTGVTVLLHRHWNVGNPEYYY